MDDLLKIIAYLWIGIVTAAIICYSVVLMYLLWPVTLLVAGIWITKRLADSIRNSVDDPDQIMLAYRADRQHWQIMSGDVIPGTYGEYLPPKSLRIIHDLNNQD